MTRTGAPQAYRNTVPVPRHWSQKRKFLQGKRGIEKPAFQLPDFIEATGISEMRKAYQDKVRLRLLACFTALHAYQAVHCSDPEFKSLFLVSMCKVAMLEQAATNAIEGMDSRSSISLICIRPETEGAA